MKKRKKDIFKDFLLFFIRRLAYVWMFFDAKATYKLNDGLKFNRKEPFVMLANHTFMFDVVHVPLRFTRPPFIVASQTLFSKQPLKFLLTQIAHAIPKSKGASDLRTARELIGAVRRGHSILIFPEGDTTFSGETNYIEESTFKLIKKLKIDVVTCNVKGGYLSKPRWATGPRKNRRIHMDYSIAISKEELKNMSLEEISKKVNDMLYNNDYEYQREHMIKHPGKQLAEGFANVTYICPECNSINSIETKGNDIHCIECDNLGKINEYGFIEGFKFDNLIQWDQYQRGFIDKLKESVIESTGDMYYANYDTGVRTFISKVSIMYKSEQFLIIGDEEIVVPLKDIVNPIVTLRRNLNFTYLDTNYVIKLDSNSASFLRVAQEKY